MAAFAARPELGQTVELATLRVFTMWPFRENVCLLGLKGGSKGVAVRL